MQRAKAMPKPGARGSRWWWHHPGHGERLQPRGKGQQRGQGEGKRLGRDAKGCTNLSGRVGKVNWERRKRQVRDWAGLGGEDSPSQRRVGGTRYQQVSPLWMGKMQHPTRSSTVAGRLWAKLLCALNFEGKGEHDEYKSHYVTSGKR